MTAPTALPGTPTGPLPLTVVIAARNEEKNIEKCLESLRPAAQVFVVDSHSADATKDVARRMGACVVQFVPHGPYPKKRQWALEHLRIETEWVLFVDADEVVPPALWEEIGRAIRSPEPHGGYLVTKGFHFLGRRFRFGGFSHRAVLLIRQGKARFEQLLKQDPDDDPFDMEVHERLIVDGSIGSLRTPLIHEDFKGLRAYIDRHNRYSTWEAAVRSAYLRTGSYGEVTISARLFGNNQERRRFLKSIVMHLPFESVLWFCYHYFLRLGILEGRRGLVASQLRAAYIQQVRAKMYETQVREEGA